ncbi:MAG: DUF58 domain-containing protein [Spirochaetales bacterium]|nr:DUF58 domain-containing protein [Spirochaetales bacterium]
MINFLYSYYLKQFLQEKNISESLNYKTDSIRANDEFKIFLNIDLPKIFIPGITTMLSQDFEFATRDKFEIKIGLKFGRNHRVIAANAPSRGEYKSQNIRITTSDVLGFSRSIIEFDARKKIIVYPNQILYTKENETPASGGKKLINSKETRKNEALTDLKKYYPGDDLRKINWKVFATSKELYVRQEDIEAMPDSMSFFVLNIDLSETNSKQQERANYLDRIIELFTALVTSEISTKGSACVAIPGRHLEIYDSSSISRFLKEVSSIWISDSFKKLEIEGISNSAVNIISFPSEKKLETIVSTLRQNKNTLNIFFKDNYKATNKMVRASILNFIYKKSDSRQRHFLLEKDKTLAAKIDKTIQTILNQSEVKIERL